MKTVVPEASGEVMEAEHVYPLTVPRSVDSKGVNSSNKVAMVDTPLSDSTIAPLGSIQSTSMLAEAFAAVVMMQVSVKSSPTTGIN